MLGAAERSGSSPIARGVFRPGDPHVNTWVISGADRLFKPDKKDL